MNASEKIRKIGHNIRKENGTIIRAQVLPLAGCTRILGNSTLINEQALKTFGR